MTKPFSRKTSRRAFSLVEITAAIGIAAFSLTAIMSLFSLMLGTERSAITQTSVPAISSAIVHQVKAAYGSDSPITEATTFYFSNEGERKGDPAEAGYACEVTPLRLDQSMEGVELIRMEIRQIHAPQILRTVYATVRHE